MLWHGICRFVRLSETGILWSRIQCRIVAQNLSFLTPKIQYGNRDQGANYMYRENAIFDQQTAVSPKWDRNRVKPTAEGE